MAGANYQPPDLATVLQTLAQFVPRPSNTPALPSNGLTHVNFQDVPEDPRLRHRQAATTERKESTTLGSLNGSLDHSRPLPGKEPRPIDPATITDWPSGLRCVMRTVGRNDASLARIKKMIQVQHEHERQWWDGREALLKKQAARVEGRQKLDEVLRSVGGNVPTPSPGADTEDNTRELIMYDRKVHKAATEMTNAMTTELKQLGVPFFGTIQSPADSIASRDPRLNYLPAQKGLDPLEMRALQKRMLELLEDMCTA